MSKSFGIVILAAGQGTRLKMDIPKPLAPVLNRKLIDYPLSEANLFLKENSLAGGINVVTGHQKELVEEHIFSLDKSISSKVSFSFQEKQLGTANALSCYFEQDKNADKYDYTLVLCADTPLITSDDLTRLYDFFKDNSLDGVAATFEENSPSGYGRILRNSSKGFSIIEEKDASEDIKQITEVNSGLYILNTKFALKHLKNIDSNNKAGEFYLTDLFKNEYNVLPLVFSNKDTFLGVNNLIQLSDAGFFLRMRFVKKLLNEGVRFIDYRHSYITDDIEIGEKSVIYPNSVIENSVIGKNVTIESGAIIKNSTIEDNVHIKAYSHLEDSIVRSSAVVGPYARLRPKTDIGPESKIGNFVEIKKSILDKGVKVSHLSYVGDAEIGENSNIGCGFITCNYDGASKHKTKIGKNSFIGSDSQTVAPVTIGDNCFVASSTTVTNDLNDGDFAISRNKQVTKAGLAKKFLKK